MRTTLVAGVDEVGRGPLAGPVVTAAVILEKDILGVTDSKRLSSKQREKLAVEILQQAVCYAYGRAEVHEIDELNIHHATLLAMKRAIDGLSMTPHQVLVDGMFVPPIEIASEAIVKGDASIPVIGAASILAKVHRDHEMIRMDSLYPGYGFAQHKGYPTKMHREAIMRMGPCAIHRRSFTLLTPTD